MATRKKTTIRNGNPVNPGFSFNNAIKRLNRQNPKKKKKTPSVSPRRARRVG